MRQQCGEAGEPAPPRDHFETGLNRYLIALHQGVLPQVPRAAAGHDDRGQRVRRRRPGLLAWQDRREGGKGQAAEKAGSR